METSCLLHSDAGREEGSHLSPSSHLLVLSGQFPTWSVDSPAHLGGSVSSSFRAAARKTSWFFVCISKSLRSHSLPAQVRSEETETWPLLALTPKGSWKSLSC